MFCTDIVTNNTRCTCNVLLRSVHETIVGWKYSVIYFCVCSGMGGFVRVDARVRRSVCACSITYLACEVHEPNCIVVCGLPDSTIFLCIMS